MKIKPLALTVSLYSAACAPSINDISTDLDNPPVFQRLREGKRKQYPMRFAKKQRAGYPDLKPLDLAIPPDEAFDRSLRAAERLAWDIVEVRRAERTFEAVDTTTIMRFKDDVIVRVSPREGGSRVDVRSASRVGKGDLGKNAARIREFFAKVAPHPQR